MKKEQITYITPQDGSILSFIAETGKRPKHIIKLLSKEGKKVLYKRKKLYRILTPNGSILSHVKGKLAGWKVGKIYGRLDCKSGMKMKKRNKYNNIKF